MRICTLISAVVIPLFVTTFVFALPDMTEVVQALDLSESQGGWSVSSYPEDSVLVEVVELEGAVGGTALKIEVPFDSTFALSASRSGSDWEHLAYRLWTDSVSTLSRVRTNGATFMGEVEGQPGSTVDVWREYGRNLGAGISWNFALDYDNEAGSGSRIIYLDAFELNSGIKIPVITSGASVHIQPDRNFYFPGDLIELTAIPDDGLEFYSWGPNVPRLPKLVVELDGSSEYTTYASQRVLFEGGALLFPIGLCDYSIVEDASPSFELRKPEGVRDGEFMLEVVGPGLLEYGVRAAEEHTRFNSSSITSETRFYSHHIGEGVVFKTNLFSGPLELIKPKFTSGQPLRIEATAGGSIVGAPANELSYFDESLTLRAVPDEGWEFEGWTGNVLSSSLEVTLAPDRSYELKATFVRTYGSGFANLSSVGEDFSPGTEGSDNLISVMGDSGSSELRWSGFGPGVLTLEYKLSSERLYHNQGGSFDGPHLEELEDGWKRLTVEVEKGLHQIRFWPPSSAELTGSIRTASFERVCDFKVVSAGSGSILGLPEGTCPELGSVLELEAIADEGISFVGWYSNGQESIVSKESKLSVRVGPSQVLVAVFEGAVLDDPIVNQVAGFEKVDDYWRFPTAAVYGTAGTLSGKVTGPSKLDISVGASGEYTVLFEVDGVVVSEDFQSYEFGPGEHVWRLFTLDENLKSESNTWITRFSRLHRVELKVVAGSLHVEADALDSERLDYYEVGRVWRQWVPEGSQLSWSVTPSPEGQFESWEGDLAGMASEASMTVMEPIISSARIATPMVEWDDVMWAVSPAEGIYFDQYGRLELTGAADTVTFGATLEGPGKVYTNSVRHPFSLEQYVDGKKVEEDWISLEPGPHEVELVVTIMIEDFDPFAGGVSLYPISYVHGYVVSLQSDGGGNVRLDPAGPAFANGEIVSVRAEAKAGNVFTGWESPFESEADEFAITVSGDIGIGANFEAVGQNMGYDWEYDGKRPIAFGSPSYLPSQSLSWSLPFGGGHKTALASTTVTGPGLLNFEARLTDHANRGTLQVLLNGEPIVSDSVYSSRLLYESFLGEGEHALAIRLDADEDSSLEDQSPVNLLVRSLTLQTDFTVAATGENSVIDRQGPASPNAIGDELLFTAPPTNDSGEVFVGWFRRDENYNDQRVTTEPELRVRVEGDVTYLAKYLNPFWADISEHMLVSVFSNGNIDFDVDGDAPTGTELIRFSGSFYAGLAFTAIEDCVLTFYIKDGDSMVLKRVDESEGVRVSIDADQWSVCHIFAAKGERLDLRYTELHGHGALLSGFSTSPGWGPSYAHSVDHAIEAARTADQTATLSVDETERSEFVAWKVADDEIDDPSIEAVANNFYTAIFSKQIETPLGPFSLDRQTDWGSESKVDMEYGSLFWRSNPGRTANGSLSIEGPKVLSFQFERSSGNPPEEFVAKLDGVLWEVESIVDGPFDKVYKLQIPSGYHVLELGLGTELSFVRVDSSEGFLLDDIHSMGGLVLIDGNIAVYEANEVIDIRAVSNNGFRFDGWEAPYDYADGPILRYTVTDTFPEARFVETGIYDTVTINGIEWRYSGLDLVRESNTGEEIWNGHYTITSEQHESEWMEASITGPAVIKIPKSSIDHKRGFTFDGTSSDLLPRSLRDEFYYYPVEAGVHELRVTALRVGAFERSLRYDIQLLPGYLVAANGYGVNLIAERLGETVAPGSTVEISAVVPNHDLGLEWKGLPQGAISGESSQAFVVNEHLDIKAFVPAEVQMFGYSFLAIGERSDWYWYDPVSGYVLSSIDQGEGVRLKLSGLRRGLYRFGFSSGTSIFDLNLYRNSDPRAVRQSLVDQDAPLLPVETNSGSVWIDSRLDVLEFGMLNKTKGIADLEFEYFEASELFYDDYDSWVDYHAGIAGGTTEWDSSKEGDTDRDGLSNDEEYSRGTSPLAPDDFISINCSKDREYLLIRQVIRERTESLNLSINGEVVDITPYLGESQIDSTDDRFELLPLVIQPSPGQTFLFFYSTNEN